ncbi:MAG: hypothetical protein MJE12_31460, partial [Alphaproteobacteria bacterium]|nr:hypothetical protein [Alphaproteobacteria bacterium]
MKKETADGKWRCIAASRARQCERRRLVRCLKTVIKFYLPTGQPTANLRSIRMFRRVFTALAVLFAFTSVA